MIGRSHRGRKPRSSRMSAARRRRIVRTLYVPTSAGPPSIPRRRNISFGFYRPFVSARLTRQNVSRSPTRICVMWKLSETLRLTYVITIHLLIYIAHALRREIYSHQIQCVSTVRNIYQYQWNNLAWCSIASCIVFQSLKSSRAGYWLAAWCIFLSMTLFSRMITSFLRSWSSKPDLYSMSGAQQSTCP